MRRLGLMPLLAVLLLSACGSGGDGPAGPDGGLSAASPSAGIPAGGPSAASPQPGATPSGPTPTGGPGGAPIKPSSTALGPDGLLPDPTLPPTGKQVTLSGTVVDGVEAGCLLLETTGTTYLLLGVPGDAVAGQRAEVVGALAPDTLSTCQQGVALQVSSYRAG